MELDQWELFDLFTVKYVMPYSPVPHQEYWVCIILPVEKNHITNGECKTNIRGGTGTNQEGFLKHT